ncbi:MarR family winged helix-turn-helix transcriptional regulator [Actinomadura atramentaria]|uniref:MarR family winged helix-turn-helix transcriptional regulator n=1 Tax=Actinomadura atramentaria TaxID=1990 RepID=UPI00036E99B2|nr:MarR family transcriptional regulator [Actinomadura atramentaria]
MPAQPSGPADPPADALVDGLVQLSFHVQAVLAAAAAEHDLSLPQVRLLGILRDRDAEMRQLARHLDLDKSSVTGLVTRAERRDLVRRVPSPRDGRAVLVTLTGHGRRLARTAERDVRARVRALTAVLDPADRATLTALADRVLAGRRTRADDPRGGDQGTRD